MVDAARVGKGDSPQSSGVVGPAHLEVRSMLSPRLCVVVSLISLLAVLGACDSRHTARLVSSSSSPAERLAGSPPAELGTAPPASDSQPSPSSASDPQGAPNNSPQGTGVAASRRNSDPTPDRKPANAIWHPAPGTTWQWQLTGPLDQTVDAAVYDIDLFDNDARVVAQLHAKGRKVVCYMNAGAWENWRPDAGQFPASVQGAVLSGYPNERWLDIRNLAVLRPLMEARMNLCRARGFDAVEPDNIDGFANDTGFGLTPQDQLAYNRFLAAAAHARGLAVALKNDVDQVGALLPSFDFAINEECFSYQECASLAPFVRAGKAVFHVEYELAPDAFCPQTRSMGFSSMQKHRSLDSWRIVCR